MADQELDRNEAATPYKLQKAKQKGQVGKSADVVSAIVFTVAATWFYWQGWDGLVGHFRYDHSLLAQAGRIELDATLLWSLVARMLGDTLIALIPFLAAIVLAAVIGNLLQTGPVISIEPLKADFQRLNPVAGMRRILSLRTLFDAARAVIKLALLGFVVYHALKALVPQFYQLASISPSRLARTIVEDASGIGVKLALLLCLIAAADHAYSRREFARKMRMSKRELKDEHKHREGDPRIRSRLRELRREALARSMAARKTAMADVVLTNPTHYSVALRYEHGQMPSPQVVAKGAGSLAAAMREIAARHRIPVVPNPPLARELFRTVEVDGHVPPALFGQVARILVWVLAMRRAQESNRAPAEA